MHIDSLSGDRGPVRAVRLQAGNIKRRMEQVRLDELVEETVAAMRAQADRRPARRRALGARRPGRPRANPEKLQRVLFNLIQNAIRHARRPAA